MFNSFDMGFGMFNVMFTIMFVVVIGMFIFVAVRGISRWNKNNNSPLLTVPVQVVSKRIDVTRSSHGNGGDMSGAHGYYTTSSTWYYITFQVESGDRMEFSVDGTEYGKIAEGDRGDLSFKGTRFISFVRK